MSVAALQHHHMPYAASTSYKHGKAMSSHACVLRSTGELDNLLPEHESLLGHKGVAESPFVKATPTLHLPPVGTTITLEHCGEQHKQPQNIRFRPDSSNAVNAQNTSITSVPHSDTPSEAVGPLRTSQPRPEQYSAFGSEQFVDDTAPMFTLNAVPPTVLLPPHAQHTNQQHFVGMSSITPQPQMQAQQAALSQGTAEPQLRPKQLRWETPLHGRNADPDGILAPRTLVHTAAHGDHEVQSSGPGAAQVRFALCMQTLLP